MMGFLGGSALKNPRVMQKPQELQAWSLGWEDPLEVETATHSSVLAWRLPWTEEPGGLQSMGSQELDMSDATEHTPSTHIYGMCIRTYTQFLVSDITVSCHLSTYHIWHTSHTEASTVHSQSYVGK